MGTFYQNLGHLLAFARIFIGLLSGNYFLRKSSITDVYQGLKKALTAVLLKVS